MLARTTLDLGQIIRARRRSAKLRQQELADRVGVSRQWIVAVEQGKSRVELGLVLRTLDVLGLELRVGPPSEHLQPFDPGLPALDLDALVAQVLAR